MKKTFNTDQDLFDAIQLGGEQRLLALQEIYCRRDHRRRMISYLLNKGCSPQDAEDLFQDAFLIFDKNIRSNKFQQQSNLFNYLFGIVKKVWLNKYRSLKRSKTADMADDLGIEYCVKEYYEKQKKEALYDQLLNLVGERCKVILTMFSEKFSMEEIGKRVDIDDAVRVRKEKYRCLMRLRKKIQDSPTLLAMVKDIRNT